VNVVVCSQLLAVYRKLEVAASGAIPGVCGRQDFALIERLPRFVLTMITTVSETVTNSHRQSQTDQTSHPHKKKQYHHMQKQVAVS
jgi:hypothetical protein